MDALIWYLLVILIASTLQIGTGFGFSIMATPFLLLLFTPYEAIQINLFLSFLLSLFMVWKVRVFIDQALVRRLVVGSVPGLLLGVLIFRVLGEEWLKLVVGGVILIVTISLLLRLRIRPSHSSDFWVGGMSGALTTSIGIPGPPLLLYFAGSRMEKEVLRATTLAFYLYIYAVSLLIHMVVNGTSMRIGASVAVALPVVLASLFFGQLLFVKLDQNRFRQLLYILLMLTGGYLILQTLL